MAGRLWSAVADLLSCRLQDDGEEDMSGQAMVGQAGPCTLPSGKNRYYRYVSIHRTGREYEKCPVCREFWGIIAQFSR